MQDYSFWKDRRVLVTGHTGFVGSWLCMVLINFGAKVYGIALPAEKDSVYKRIEEKVNILSREQEMFEPEVVFHLAAFGFIQECLADPTRAFTTNTVGNSNVLMAANSCSAVKSIVVASSDKVYKNEGIKRLFTEKDELGGVDPYSASKACQDIISRSYYDSYLKDKDIGMCIVRPSNILGGGDHHFNRLIPSMYHAYAEGEKPLIRNPQAVRPWQDILDMCDAYLFLAERAYRNRICDVVNVGPKPEGVVSVGEIAQKVGGLFGNHNMMTGRDENTVNEHMYLGLSIEKIKEIGWSPKMTIDDTLKNVYQCYNCRTDEELYEVCLEQIHEYYER